MRETWVPLFQDIRQSSLWAHDSDTRIVWFTLLTLCDPEGYVPGSLPGIALAANIPLAKVREAMALFESPDPDSRTPEFDGRRIEKVERGWLILNYEAYQARKQRESEKARKRNWARGNRAQQRAANTNDQPPRSDGVAVRSETVDSSESKSESKSKSRRDPDPAPPRFSKARPQSGGPCPCGMQEEPLHPVGWCGYHGLPVPPEGLSEAYQRTPDALGTTRPVMFHTLDGWEPTSELRAEAQLAGVTDFDERVAAARLITIGGPGGVRDRTQWVRTQFPRWRRWRETDAAKGSTVRHPSGAMPEPAGARATGWGKHVPFPAQAFCSKHALDSGAEVRAFLATGQADTVTHEQADKLFRKWLIERAKRRRGKPAA